MIGAYALTENFFISQEAEKVLSRIAKFGPTEVMNSVGEAMLDEKLGYHFFLGNYKGLIAALPADVVKEWLKGVGVEGARHLARHLAQPFLDSNGIPTLPELTEFVLREFEQDDRT